MEIIFQEQRLIVPFRNRNKENSATWQHAIRIRNRNWIIGSNWTFCDNLVFFWIGSDVGLLVTWGILHHFWNLTWSRILLLELDVGQYAPDQQLRTGITCLLAFIFQTIPTQPINVLFSPTKNLPHPTI